MSKINQWLEEEGVKESLYNQKRANKWSDATVPVSGTTGDFYVSGSTPQIVGPLDYGFLYTIISDHDFFVVSTTDPTYSASISSSYKPADLPVFHIPYSGSSEYVSIHHYDQTSPVQVWFNIAERKEGGAGKTE